MIKFGKLTCNHMYNPVSADSDILLNWNYDETCTRNLKQVSYCVSVAESGNPDKAVFTTGVKKGEDMSVRLPKSSIKELTEYYWKVTSTMSDGETPESPVYQFTTGIFDKKTWENYGCRWITARTRLDRQPEALEFRRTVKLPKSKIISSAFAYVFNAGIGVFTVNGERTDDRFLAPAWSNFACRCIYETYDISSLLVAGSNTISLTCGSGYDANYSKYASRFMGKKGMICLILLKFTDGTELAVPSDGRWECYDSKVTKCSMYGGESYDSTKTEFTKYPITADDTKAPYYPDGVISPREIPQIRCIKTLKPVSVNESVIPERVNDDGAVIHPAIPGHIFDFGENSAGVCRIVLNAPKGTTVRLFHTEMIFPDGAPDRTTNRLAMATDTYVCSGQKNEVYMPEFTYHGFRYVHVSGLPDIKCLKDITKCVMSSDFEAAGTFVCSDDTINRIHGMAAVGIRNNMVSFPTDCAVRDERTPCAMDSQTIEKAVMFNYDTAAYYTNWLRVYCDPLKPDENLKGNPDWSGDIVSLMWRIRCFYGDLRPAEKYFGHGLSLFLNTCRASENGIWEKGFGDWCHPNENRWETFFGSVTAVETALLYAMGRKLEILGTETGVSKETIAEIKKETDRIKEAFGKLCIHKNGKILNGDDTEYAMPLYEGLVDGDDGEKAFGLLKKKLKKEYKTDLGIYGEMSLYEVLRRNGEQDLALELLRNPEYPGYGFLLAKGATSLWEQWRYKGRMDSHSHGMFAGVDTSFYTMFAGIVPETPGFERITVKPMLPEAMSFACASLDTVKGKISVKTEYLCRGYEISITVPVGVTADVIFPELPEPDTKYSFFDGELPAGFRREISIGSGHYLFRLIPASLQQDH